jgi:hypothetical protein
MAKAPQRELLFGPTIDFSAEKTFNCFSNCFPEKENVHHCGIVWRRRQSRQRRTVYIHPRMKVAAFLLASSFIGGFFLATEVTQYVFEKHKENPSGGGGGERDGKERDGNGKKKGQQGDGDKAAEGKGDRQEEAGAATDDKSRAADDVDAAVRYLVDKTIRLNPGQQPPRYSYHAMRGLFGQGDADRFSLRTWSTRGQNLCETQQRGEIDCRQLTIIIGSPNGAGALGSENRDVAMTPEEVRAFVEQARKSATLAQKRAADKAIVKGDVSYAGGDVLRMDGDAPREFADGEQMALLVIGEHAFPVLKGNLIAFPDYIPSIDKAPAPKPATTPVVPSVKTATPVAAALASVGPPKRTVEKPKATGFSDPKSIGLGFGAPPQKIARSFQAANDSRDAGVSGALAWESLVARPLIPTGRKPVGPPPYVGFFQADGRFLQLTRDRETPLEIIVAASAWTFADGKLCYAAAADKPVDSPKGGRTICVAPSLSGANISNLVNFRGDTLAIAREAELIGRDAPQKPKAAAGKPGSFKVLEAPSRDFSHAAQRPAKTPPGASRI